MSELVEDNLQLIPNQNFSPEPNLLHSDISILQCLAQHILKTHTNNFNIKVQEFNKYKKTLTLFTYLKSSKSIFDVLFIIKIDLANKKIEFVINFLQQQTKFSKLPSPIRRSVCRSLLKINKQVWRKGFKLIQNMQNGSLSLVKASEESQYIFDSKIQLWNTIKNSIKEAVQVVEGNRMKIGQIIDQERNRALCLKRDNEGESMGKESLALGRLVGQISISHIRFNFKEEEEVDSCASSSKLNIQQQTLKRLISQIRNEKFLMGSNKLYTCQFSTLLNIPGQQFKYQINSLQQTQYTTYLKTPLPRDSTSGQNKYILNQIEVLNPQTVKFNTTQNQGGKNHIYASKISFFYCSSSSPLDQKSKPSLYKATKLANNKNKKQHTNPVLNKILAVKVPTYQGSQKIHQQQENEEKIVTLFKNGVSAYVLKYYKSLQSNFELRNCLLMDYLPTAQPLSNFIEIFKQTLSLNSKIYLAVNISNSLRFIDDYEVVHMDLSLNNVLVYKDYLTKLIDFGEAYSSKLKSSHGSVLKRGYTFPFCAPEYFSRKGLFTIKQDVFSLGMILYRLIFGQYPFFPSVEATRSYKDKSYNERILLAPERGQDYGNIQTINLLYRIIFKCLSTDQLIRCQPSWLTIFLKLIYFHLI